jgi:hypothetical protein
MAACATACLLTPSVALAANTSCANADYLFPGSRAQYEIAGGSSLYFKTRVTAGRSYTVTAWAPTQNVSAGGVALNVTLWSDSTCTTGPSGVVENDYEPEVFGIPGHMGDQDNIIPAADGTLYIQVANTVAPAYPVHVLFMETTLFSPWWFTGGSNQGYVEVRNNMSDATTAHLTLYRSDGTVCGTSNLPLNGNGNTVVEIGTVGSCGPAQSGSAQLAFAGTPGGMSANITTLSVVLGTSFDSPFTPRMVWTTFSR